MLIKAGRWKKEQSFEHQRQDHRQMNQGKMGRVRGQQAVSHHANWQKFNESIEWYKMFPPNWGWVVGKWVLMQFSESIKWCNFLKDKLTLSSKFINAWSQLARPCLEFALQKNLCNFTNIVYMMFTAIAFSHQPRKSLGLLTHTTLPPCNPCSQFSQ